VQIRLPLSPSSSSVRRYRAAVVTACAAVAAAYDAAAAAPLAWATSVPAGTYTTGTVYNFSGTTYADATRALGAPAPTVGTAPYVSVTNPFSGPYENTQLVQIGQGGSLTVQLGQPVRLGGPAKIGVFTGVTLNDASYPDGSAGSPVQTIAAAEYGAERSAVVEVAGALGDFRSLGRVLFVMPTNYYANVTSPSQYPAPSSPVPADFGTPIVNGLSQFANQSFEEVIATLNGSGGGTWIDLPAALGLDAVNYVRFSDPRWVLPDGTLATHRVSIYDNPNNPTLKPADLLVDAVAAVPEPGSAALALGVAVMAARRHRRA